MVSDGNIAFIFLTIVNIIAFGYLAVEDARADVDIFDINDGIEDLKQSMGDDPYIGICPSNRWYFPFINSDGDFNVSWTDNNGTSWTNVTVQSEGWKGETKMWVESIQCWTNNTTVIILMAEDADNAEDAYLFWLWGDNNASDPNAWNFSTIRGGASVSEHFSMIFNRTGILYIVFNYNNQIRYRLWDVSDGTFGADTLWYNYDGQPMIQCDHNNIVWVGFAVSGFQNCWSWDQGTKMQTTTSADRTVFSSFFVTADNSKVFTGHYQYLTTHQFAVGYESTTNTTMTTNLFLSDSDDWGTAYYSTGNVYGDTVSVIQIRLETGAEEFVRLRAQYDAIDATWEGSETVLWTTPTDDDLAYHYASGPNSVWPKIDNVSVCRLLSGDIHYWMWKDELGAPDDWYDIVYTDSPVFTYWDWSPPSGPGPGNATNETASTFGVWWSQSCITTAILIFVIVTVIAMMFNRK